MVLIKSSFWILFINCLNIFKNTEIPHINNKTLSFIKYEIRNVKDVFLCQFPIKSGIDQKKDLIIFCCVSLRIQKPLRLMDCIEGMAVKWKKLRRSELLNIFALSLYISVDILLVICITVKFFYFILVYNGSNRS